MISGSFAAKPNFSLQLFLHSLNSNTDHKNTQLSFWLNQNFIKDKELNRRQKRVFYHTFPYQPCTVFGGSLPCGRQACEKNRPAKENRSAKIQVTT